MLVFRSTFSRSLGLAAVISLLAACQQVPMLPGLTPYRIDIQQGNVVTQDMVDKLKPGMTRQQVRFVLGTPPIVDPFRQDRWDYVYYYNKAGRLAEHRRLVLLFDGDTLKRIDGDVVPLSPEQAAARAAAAGGNAAQADGKSADAPAEEKGFFGRLWEKIGL
jgi:outer membrane protein assembly factor BamE